MDVEHFDDQLVGKKNGASKINFALFTNLFGYYPFSWTTNGNEFRTNRKSNANLSMSIVL